jgi:hypothetical protein
MDDTIRKLVNVRRQALDGADDDRRPWGLALSGGGIRSATFCLGLLKALASHRQLLRFDIVSTVSGGGYVAATLGRLCTDATSAEQVREIEHAFGDADRVRFGWWLRGNGRYLIPGGMRDTLSAVGLYLRSLLGTHLEIAIAASLIGMVLAGANLLLWDAVFRAVDLNSLPDEAFATDLASVHSMRLLVEWATNWPTLWFTLVGPFVASIVLIFAHWSVRDKPSMSALSLQLAMWCALGAAAHWIGPELVSRYAGSPALVSAFVSVASGWVVALLWVMWRSRKVTAAELRNELTDGLAALIQTSLLIAMLGLLDRSAWWLTAEQPRLHASYGAALLAAAAVLRCVLPLLLSQRRDVPGLSRSLLLLSGSGFGLLMSFCLAVWWVGWIYTIVLLPVFTQGGLDFSRGWVWLGTVCVVVGSYALVTGHTFAFLNDSSLHGFYRARIVRGYLGAANAGRLGARPTERVSDFELPQVPVGEIDPNDDIALPDYAPHAHGGPVHLVNVCINQTHDTKQRLFNRDRKSQLLTIGPQGWMQTGGARWSQAHGDAALTLGAWTAISGAAFAPGLGRLTKRGIAAMSVFAGMRLGYWWNSAEAGISQYGAVLHSSPLLMKTRFMVLECMGAFPGSSSATWYLSDGGHFENTGAYALLRQEAELIVIADCGADPEYRFSDIEVLIRRARIDLHADITFMKPRPGADWAHLAAFGSLNDLASPESQACLALAQVRYASGATGQIVLVKPNVSAALPVDLVNFRADHPLFPQQPTTDQFFDEAQWESYFRLGSEIGGRLHGDMLDDVALGAVGMFVPDDGQHPVAAATSEANAAGGTEANDKDSAVAAGKMSRFQARVRAGAVTASLGIGTLTTVGVAAWQIIDHWQTQQAQIERSEISAFKELSERWAHLYGGKSPAGYPGLLAAELLHTGDLLCREGRENFMAKYRLSVRIVDDAKQACANEAVEERSPACVRLLDDTNGIDCLQPERGPACVPRYWARDYSGRTGARENCSGTLPEPWPIAVWLRDLVVGLPEVRAAPLPEAHAEGVKPTHPAAASPSGICKHTVVYIEIYGPALHDKAQGLATAWRAIGASVPPIEDVLATSRNTGHAPPQGHHHPSIVIRDESARACAQALSEAGASPTGQPWIVKMLPRSTGPAGSIDVWLPRPGEPAAN